MQEIEALVAGVRLNNNFLNDVATVYERKGADVAALYVRGKFAGRLSQDEQKAYAQLLLVIQVLQKYNLPGPVASFIIKKLNGLQKARQAQEQAAAVARTAARRPEAKSKQEVRRVPTKKPGSR